jgi:hypothetical protein
VLFPVILYSYFYTKILKKMPTSTFVVVVGVVVVVEVLVDVDVEVGEVASLVVVVVVVVSTTTACVVGASGSVGAIVLAMVVSATADVIRSVGWASLLGVTAEVNFLRIGGTALVAALLGATERRSALVDVALTLRFLLMGANAALQGFLPQHSTILPRALLRFLSSARVKYIYFDTIFKKKKNFFAKYSK